MIVRKTLNFKTFLKLSMSIFIIFGAVNTATANEQIAKLPINQRSFVILQYHHVSTDTPKSTSVSPETFAQHMAFLAKNYQVIDLADALFRLKNNEKLPDKSVAITFDDGYTNILKNAHPILTEHNFPYTVFINPAIIDEYPSQLTWLELEKMEGLATFANHSLDHDHLLARYKNESQDIWIKRVMNDINSAEAILKEKTGYSKKWLAYPYGEFNKALKVALMEQGYVGFAQQSGAVGKYSDFGAVPRFPAAGNYANLDSLETKLNSLSMPVISVKPTNNQFALGDTLEQILIEIEDDDIIASALTCYFNGELIPIKHNKNKVSINMNHTLNVGRARVNCTAPSITFNRRYYWYSYPMFTPTSEGEFLY